MDESKALSNPYVSILFHHYKQLTECIKQVEQIDDKVETLVLLLHHNQEKKEK
jgi:hypothetical protein